MPKKNGHIEIQMESGFQPWLAAAREDNRPVLQGVWIDPKGYMVASDGSILAVVPCKITGAPRSFPGALVPADFVKGAAKNRKGVPVWWPLLTLDMTANTATREVSSSSERVTVDLIAGTFPNWRQIIPARRDLGAQRIKTYDPNLLSKVSGAIGANFPHVYFHKNSGPAVVTGSQDKAFGLLSPVVHIPGDARLQHALKLRQASPKPNPLEESHTPSKS